MARLKNNGHEVARFEHESGPSGNGHSRALGRRIVYSVRSTGAVLRKESVLFPASGYSPEYWHCYGWKIAARPKNARSLEQLRPALLDRGFHEVMP